VKISAHADEYCWLKASSTAKRESLGILVGTPVESADLLESASDI
jgi:hypothetical protein